MNVVLMLTTLAHFEHYQPPLPADPILVTIHVRNLANCRCWLA